MIRRSVGCLLAYRNNLGANRKPYRKSKRIFDGCHFAVEGLDVRALRDRVSEVNRSGIASFLEIEMSVATGSSSQD